MANTINSSKVLHSDAEQIVLEPKDHDQNNRNAKQQEKEDRQQKIQNEKEQKAIKDNQHKVKPPF